MHATRLQKLCGLVERECKVGRPDFDDRIFESIAVHRQHRINTAGDDKLQVVVRVAQEKFHFARQTGIGQVQVVQNQSHRSGMPGYCGTESHQVFTLTRVCAIQWTSRRQFNPTQCESAGDVGPEGSDVTSLKPDPDREVVGSRLSDPLSGHERLAGSRRRTHQYKGNPVGRLENGE